MRLCDREDFVSYIEYKNNRVFGEISGEILHFATEVLLGRLYVKDLAKESIL